MEVIKNKRIVMERPFYRMPSPFITEKVTISGELDKEYLLKVLEHLGRIYPITRATIKSGENGSIYMDMVNLAPQMRVLFYERQRRDTWCEVVAKRLQNYLALDRYAGVEVLIIHQEKDKDFDVVLIVHHLYGDGMSVTYLMQDLIKMYCDGIESVDQTEKPHRDIESSSIFEKIPGLVDLSAWYERIDRLNSIWKEKYEGITEEQYENMFRSHNEKVGYALKLKQIQGDSFRSLLTICKQNGVTINSAIATAILYALTEEEKSMKATVAVDGRSILADYMEENPYGYMGDFASCITPMLTYDRSKDFWDNVKNIHVILRSELSDINKVLGTIRLFSRLEGSIFDAIYAARYGLYTDYSFLGMVREVLGFQGDDGGYDLSNLGKIQMDIQNPEYEVLDFVLVPNLTMVCDCTFGVATANDTLTIAMPYKSKNVTEENAEKIMQIVYDKLSTI